MTRLRQLVLGTALAFMAFAPAAIAQDFTGLPGAIPTAEGSIAEAQPPVPCRDFSCRFFAVTTAHGFVYGIVNAIVGLLGFALLAAYFYAAMLWMTSFGDSSRITTAKKIFLEATLGLVVVLLAYFIVSAVIRLKG